MPRRQSFLSGAAILAGAVAVTKVLGALYKIPLGNLLDSQGMAHFYAAYNVYNLLLMLSTAGLPRGWWHRRRPWAATVRPGASFAARWRCWASWDWCFRR